MQNTAWFISGIDVGLGTSQSYAKKIEKILSHLEERVWRTK